MTKEIICIHVGQAGIQIGSAIWELLCAEHLIDVNGVSVTVDETESHHGINRFFNQSEQGQYIPRSLFIDLEPSVADEVRHGCYKQLFSCETIVSGYEDAASIFSRGYFSFGRFFINDIIYKINKQIELCESPQAFMFTHSSGGGTGSGLLSLIMEEIEDFSKILKMDINIHPSFPISPIVVEPYNSVLTSHYTMDNTDISFFMDNEALYNLAFKHLEQEQMNYHLINRLVAQIMSNITASSRFEGQSATINEYIYNVVPYPRIHFPICSLSPVMCQSKMVHYVNSIYSITKDAMSHDFQTIRCVPMEGKFMSCCLLYRGDISPADVYHSVERMRFYDRMQFVDWSPTGMKITICHRAGTAIEKSGMSYSSRGLTMICNNSVIVDALLQNTFRFHILFKKRAFVHWFIGEGMEEEEFKDSLENIACLVKDYEECAYPTKLLHNAANVENDANNKSNVEDKFDEMSNKRHIDTMVKEVDEEREGEVDFNINISNAEKINSKSNLTVNNNKCCTTQQESLGVNKKALEGYISEEQTQISSFSTPESLNDEKIIWRDKNYSVLDDMELTFKSNERLSPPVPTVSNSDSKLPHNRSYSCNDNRNPLILHYHKIHTLNENTYLNK